MYLFTEIFLRQKQFFKWRQFTALSLHTGYQLSHQTGEVNPPQRAGGWGWAFPAQTCDKCNQLELTLLNLGWQEGHLAACPWHEYLSSTVITELRLTEFQGIQCSSEEESESLGLSLWEYSCAEGERWISPCSEHTLLILSRQFLCARWGES